MSKDGSSGGRPSVVAVGSVASPVAVASEVSRPVSRPAVPRPEVVSSTPASASSSTPFAVAFAVGIRAPAEPGPRWAVAGAKEVPRCRGGVL